MGEPGRGGARPCADGGGTTAAGQLIIITGCMFAGKTARLIAHLRAAQEHGKHVLAFKHVLDARYDAAALCTHDGARFAGLAVGSAAEIMARATSADVVGVDEAQFFGLALLETCALLRTRGITLVVAGIDRDAWGQPFSPLPELAGMADAVERRAVPCAVCGAPSPFTQRLIPVCGGQMVGGPAEYEPRCHTHFTPLPPPAPVYVCEGTGQAGSALFANGRAK